MSNLHAENKWIVCGVQMDVAFGDVDANLSKIIHFGKLSQQANARLVVFPECALTGYSFDNANDAAAAAISVDSSAVTTLADLSRELSLVLCVGTVWRDEQNLLRNTVLTFQDGNLIDQYHKVHLPFMGVDRFVVPGTRIHEPVDIGGLKVGIHICYEGGFPEVARCLTLAGADLVVLPTNWPPGSGVSCKVIPSCRALENRVYFMSINRVGHEHGFDFIGNSSWAQPSGEEIQRLPANHEDLLIAEIDPLLARQKRLIIEPGVYEVDRIADRHPELYHPLTKR